MIVARPPAAALGREIITRLRLPGPARGHSRPARIGSIASASGRFATSLARPVPYRQRLQGPEVVRAHSIRDVGMAPPRWWYPTGATSADAGESRPRHFGRPDHVRRDELPQRTLPRAVHSVPDGQTWTPGSIVGGLVSTVAPVRRLDAVAAVGPMLTSHDQAKLTAARAARVPVAPAPVLRRTTAAPGPAARPASAVSAAADPAGSGPHRPSAGPTSAAPSAPAATTPTDRPAAPASSGSGPGPSAPTSAAATPAPAGSSPASSAPAGVGPITTAPTASWQPSRPPRFDAARRAAVALTPGSAATAPPPAGPGTPQPIAALRRAIAPGRVGNRVDAVALASAEAGPRLGSAPLRRMIGRGQALRPSLRLADATPALVAVPARSPEPVRALEFGRRPRRAAATSAAADGPAPAGAPATAPTATAPTATAPTATAPTATAPTSVPTGTTTSAAAPAAPGLPATRPGGVDRSVTGRAPGQHRRLDTEAGAPAIEPAGSLAATASEVPAGPAASRSVAPSALRRSSAAPREPRGVQLAAARSLTAAVRPGRQLTPAVAAATLPSASGRTPWLRRTTATAEPVFGPRGGQRASTRSLAAAVAPDTVLTPAVSVATLPNSATYLPWVPPAARSTRATTGGTTGPRPAPGRPDEVAGSAAAAAIASGAMGELLAIGRPAKHGAVVDQPRVLATAFGSSAEIRPAGSAQLRAGFASSAPPAGAPSAPTRPAATRPGTAVVRPGAAATGPRTATARPTRDAPTMLRRSPAERARTGATGPTRGTGSTAGRSIYLPAPPPVSIRRAPASAPPAVRPLPPVPASAAPGSTALVRGPDGALRPSLVDSTTDLFNQPDATSSAFAEQQGSAMASDQPQLRVVRGGEDPQSAETAVDAAAAVFDDPRRLAELVDKVVDRIENKVVDELERRGRRYNPGVF